MNLNYLWKSDGTTAGTSLIETFTRASVGPAQMTASGGKLFFNAMGYYGSGQYAASPELFVSDGTPAGTLAVTTSVGPVTGAADLTDVNGTLFFTGANGQLWKSDGTPQGTMQVATFPPGGLGILHNSLQNVNGTLYFQGQDAAHGDALWKTDGTNAGTTWITSNFNGDLTYANGTLFFGGIDNSHGQELWKTDGTPAGTMIVKDIATLGAIGSVPYDLTAYKGELYFSAADDTHGDELWKSDGTAAGTVIVDDINPGFADSFPRSLTVCGGTLYFTADDGKHGNELWKTDGTTAGTVMVKDINPSLSSGRDGTGSTPQFLTDSNGTLFFSANDGSYGLGVWKSDGTTAGTQRLVSVGGSNTGINFLPQTTLGGRFLFIADDYTHGQEVWASDGTPAGTTMLRDIWPGPNSSNPHNFVNVGGKVLFAATDTTQGTQLWSTDGTPAGTSLLSVLTKSIEGTDPVYLSPVGDRLLFFAAGAGAGLWSSDGTAGGTGLIQAGSFSNEPPIVENGTLYFASAGNLWKSDGTAAGTVLIKSFPSAWISDLTLASGRLFFSSSDAATGQELWCSDGTAAGTYLVADLAPGAASSDPQDITNVNGEIFFQANGTLYKTDGSLGGTIALTAPGAIGGAVGQLPTIALGNDLLFEAGRTVSDPRIWRSDGTTGGTFELDASANLRPISNFAVLNGLAYVVSRDSASHFCLYKTDGTDAGTSQVFDFGPTPSEGNLFNLNGTLYFAGPGGTSLWKTDGTTGGTVQIISFAPGARNVTDFINANGTLYFLDNDHVYTSDGTTAGTIQLDGQPAQSFEIAELGDQLFLSAQSANYGLQLWVDTPPTAPHAPAAPAGLTTVAVSGGEVDLSWAANAGVLSFQIQRSSDPAFGTINQSVTLRDPAATGYVDTSVTPGKAYYYRVAASNRGGQSPFAPANAGTPAAPIAPSALTASTFPDHVDLSWANNATNQTGFRIDRSATSDFAHIDATFTVPAAVTSFSDTSVSYLNSYYYRVSAFNAAGPSGAVAIRVTTPDLPPASLVATRVSTSEVDLQWTNTSTTEIGYHILRAIAGGTPVEYQDVFAGQTSYNDTAANNDISYSYVIEQYGAYGASDSSAATCLSVVPQFTTLLKTLPDLSFPESSSYPSKIVMSGGIGYFSAPDQSNPMGLWRTDGTDSGTYLVKAIQAASSQSQLYDLTDVNGTLYFVASDPNAQQSTALWKSDGTAAGTVLVRDLSPSSSYPSSIHDLTNFSGTLYFRGGGQESGAKADALWKSDGTLAGTVIVSDLPRGDGYPYQNQMLNVNGKLFLAAGTTSGSALYVSDGTAAGTTPVLPGAPAMSIQDLTEVGNGVYFLNATTDRLWYSDGTAAGTFAVPGSPAVPFSQSSANDARFTDVGGKLFYTAFSASGLQLWTSDGTAADTHAVVDVPPSSNVMFIANLNGKAVFTIEGSASSTVEITDGTAAGTSVIGTYASDPQPTNISELAVYDGAAYYASEQPGQRWTLYKSDGTPGSAAPLAVFAALPANFAIANGTLTFSGYVDYTGTEPWRTDGTVAGTYMIHNISSETWTAQPDWMTNVNGMVFFASASSVRTGSYSLNDLSQDISAELWKTDGTAAGTLELASVAPSNLVGVGSTLYFTGVTQASGAELWKSDGTVAGTVMVKDIAPGAASSRAMPLANLNGILLFGVPVGGEYQLWRSDGTDAGTYQVSPALLHLYYSSDGQPGPDFVVSGGVFYFVSGSGGNGYELWRSDGTSAGTSMVSDIVPGADSSNPADFVNVNGTLYFTAFDATQTNVHDLYKSDGTAAGTVSVAVVGSAVQSITDVNGEVFFVGRDNAHGMELWKVDSAGGAGIVRDIVPGSGDSIPQDLTAVGNTLYFVAQDPTGNTLSLYKSDGTAAGTVPVRSFFKYDMIPVYLTNGNGTLFYSDGLHLWSSDGTLAGTQNVMTIADPLSISPVTFAGAPDVVLGNTLLFSAYNSTTSGRDLRWVTTAPPLPPVSLSATAPGGTGGTQPAGAPAIRAAVHFSATTPTATLTWQ